MDDDVLAYLDAVPPERRPLFDRVHRLVTQAHPAADVVLSYKMPTFVVGSRRLHVGVWSHGLSMYGWRQGEDDGFLERHPDLWTEKGTLKLTPRSAGAIEDDELEGFLRATLSEPGGSTPS